jgi:hypothetical protein
MVLGHWLARWIGWRGKVCRNVAIVGTFRPVRVKDTEQAIQTIHLSSVILLPVPQPTYLILVRVPALIAASEIFLFPCPTNAGVQLRSLLRTPTLFRLVFEVSRGIIALGSFCIARSRAVSAVLRILPVDK